MKTIKDKLREKLYVYSNYRLSNEYYNKTKYECYVRVSGKLNIELNEKCNEVNYKVCDQLLWNK